MSNVIGVKFKTGGRVYFFDPVELEIHTGDGVIVETARGEEFGDVVSGPMEVEEKKIVAPLKPVLRVATEEDWRLRRQFAAKESEAYAICLEKIQAHKLDMKLVDVEYTYNGSKVVFYFTADERVDFRELVKDLAYVFKTRIELRQIGVRDEAKMLGGLGPCGRPVCCKTFLDDFRPVSIKMAKEQNLSLSPTKISGLCGRLMCCLQYEESAYEQMRKLMPKVGKEIETPDGVGVTVENNVITEKTKVRITAEDGSFEIKEYPYAILGPGAAQRQKEAEAADQATAGEEALPPKPAPVLPPRQRNDRRSDRPQGNRKPQGDNPGKKSPERKPQDAACFRENLFPAERYSPERAFPAAPWQGISLLRSPRTAVSGGTTAVPREITGDRRGREPDLRKINLLRGTGSPNPKRINRRKTGSSPLRGPRERLPKETAALLPQGRQARRSG